LEDVELGAVVSRELYDKVVTEMGWKRRVKRLKAK